MQSVPTVHVAILVKCLGIRAVHVSIFTSGLGKVAMADHKHYDTMTLVRN